MVEVFVAIADGTHQYYLLKIQRRGFDVYCFPPHLGIHFSLHESGVSHFRFEEKAGGTGREPPVVLLGGEAGKPIGSGIIGESLNELGRAEDICTALYPIDSLGEDFQEFNRKPKELSVINKGLFSKDIDFIEIGVCAVPARNEISFEFYHPNISADLLYKVSQCEPQIWIYAKPQP